MRSIIIFSLILLIDQSSFARYRAIDLQEELKTAAFVGELVFSKYDTIGIPKYSQYYQRILKDSITGKEHSDTIYTDSVFVLNKLYFIDEHGNSTTGIKIRQQILHDYYWPRPDTLPRKSFSFGYWPKVGDTCLVVVDKEGYISIFGLAKDNNYIFWDPYQNSSWISIFAFDAPFKSFPKPPSSAFDISSCERDAKRFNRQFACKYHCIINRDQFWNEVMQKNN
jgi:hypothetical protein